MAYSIYYLEKPFFFRHATYYTPSSDRFYNGNLVKNIFQIISEAYLDSIYNICNYLRSRASSAPSLAKSAPQCVEAKRCSRSTTSLAFFA